MLPQCSALWEHLFNFQTKTLPLSINNLQSSFNKVNLNFIEEHAIAFPIIMRTKGIEGISKR